MIVMIMMINIIILIISSPSPELGRYSHDFMKLVICVLSSMHFNTLGLIQQPWIYAGIEAPLLLSLMLVGHQLPGKTYGVTGDL